MDALPTYSNRLIFAVPNDSHLYDSTLNILQRADLQFQRPPDSGLTIVRNHPVVLIFLPSSDIPALIAEGRVDLGITNLTDILEFETKGLTTASRLEYAADLDFGHRDLQLQVRTNGGVATIEDLTGRKITTKHPGLVENYLEQMARVTQSPETQLAKAEVVVGSFDTAWLLDDSDAVANFVESGRDSNPVKLKTIAKIARSSAHLVATRPQRWAKLVDMIIARARGVVAAQGSVLCQFNVMRHDLLAAKQIASSPQKVKVQTLELQGWYAVSAVIQQARVATVMDALESLGATDILTIQLANTRLA